MYVQPLTNPVIQPVAQGVLNPWDRQLEHPGKINGLSGLSGLGGGIGMGSCGPGLGCAECGGTCGGKNKSGLSGVFDFLDGVSPFTSLILHLGAAYVAYKIFRMVFYGAPAKARREGIAHAQRRRARAIAAGDAAVKRAKRRPRLTMESF